MRSQLRHLYTRPRTENESTDFAISRFLVPAMCNFDGWAIFCDGDMLCRSDISHLYRMRDEKYAVQVVKHDHRPREETKFLGQKQLAYPRKNWSSVMLMNCSRCKSLNPPYVNTAPGVDLHRFAWLEDEAIGELPREWNHLVGYDSPNQEAKIVHYTLGMPFFKEFSGCEFSQDWQEEKYRMGA